MRLRRGEGLIKSAMMSSMCSIPTEETDHFPGRTRPFRSAATSGDAWSRLDDKPMSWRPQY